MHPDDADPAAAQTVPSGKRLAVLETEAHAEAVRARAAGEDVLEAPLPAAGGEPSPLGQRPFPAAADWERTRPLEGRAVGAPQVPFSSRWDAARGRFCVLRGVGSQPLHLLRARRRY